MPSTTRSDEMLTRIRALLAQAESTTFAEEAEAFTAKATELMTRYAIDTAMLWDAEQRHDTPSEIRIELHRPFVPQKAVLVHQVASCFGCQAIRLGRSASTGVEPIAIVGFDSDLSMVELLITSLLVQLTTSMTESSTARHHTANQVASYRRSFIMGFTETVSTRLQEQSRQARRDRDEASRNESEHSSRREPTKSTALVLADRAATVGQDFRRRFPRVRTSSISAGSSADGRAAGSEAGRRADLGGVGLGRHRAVGPVA